MFKTILQIFPLQNQHRKCLKSADSAWFKSIRDHNLTRLLHLYCCAVKCLVCLCRQYLEFFFRATLIGKAAHAVVSRPYLGFHRNTGVMLSPIRTSSTTAP